MSIDRPKIKVSNTNFDKFLIALSTIILIFQWIYVIRAIFMLPDIIPTHFNFSGVPDSFGSKFTILLLPILLTIFYIAFSLLSRVPQFYNYPVEITKENAERQYKNSRTMFWCLLTEMSIFFFFTTIQTVRISLNKVSTLGNYALLIFLIAVFSTLVYFIYKIIKLK